MLAQNSRSVNHQYFIKAPPKKVFNAITDAKWLVKGLSDDAKIDARKEGPIQ